MNHRILRQRGVNTIFRDCFASRLCSVSPPSRLPIQPLLSGASCEILPRQTFRSARWSNGSRCATICPGKCSDPRSLSMVPVSHRNGQPLALTEPVMIAQRYFLGNSGLKGAVPRQQILTLNGHAQKVSVPCGRSGRFQNRGADQIRFGNSGSSSARASPAARFHRPRRFTFTRGLSSRSSNPSGEYSLRAPAIQIARCWQRRPPSAPFQCWRFHPTQIRRERRNHSR